MQEIREFYNPIAVACSRIYFSMEQLANVHFLYHFSLRFFLDTFSSVLYDSEYVVALNHYLHTRKLKKEVEKQRRFDTLLKEIFAATFRRVSSGLLHKDRLSFALRLAQIYIGDSVDSQVWEILFQGRSMSDVDVEMVGVAAGTITKEQSCSLSRISQV
jgi:dynein heavy chain 1